MTSQYVLRATASLLETERTEERQIGYVVNSLLRVGRWTMPIAIEETSYAVMDGHHRLAAAKELGLSVVPCLLLSYDQISVESRRADFEVTPQEIVRRALARNLYPPKTTRHILPNAPTNCFIPLAELRDSRPRFENHLQWIWGGGKPPHIQTEGARYSGSCEEHWA